MNSRLNSSGSNAQPPFISWSQGCGHRTSHHGAHPIAARVIVNRVWQFHYGEGLVRTPSDFGVMGDEPIHDRLLDWLAAEFVENGWSMKHLHRLLDSLWTDLWIRSPPQRRRRAPRASARAHSSVYRILKADRDQQRQPRKRAP